MDEEKQKDNDVNYIKKYLCPKYQCTNHEKIYCEKHDILYCAYYYCDDCLKEIKLLKLNRCNNE